MVRAPFAAYLPDYTVTGKGIHLSIYRSYIDRSIYLTYLLTTYLIFLTHLPHPTHPPSPTRLGSMGRRAGGSVDGGILGAGVGVGGRRV